MNTPSHTSPLIEIQKAHPSSTLIRMPALCALTGLSRATISKRFATDPTFPRRVRLSDSKSRGAPVGFVLSEVQAWITAQIAKRDLEAQA